MNHLKISRQVEVQRQSGNSALCCMEYKCLMTAGSWEDFAFVHEVQRATSSGKRILLLK